jgi:CubicO group peptidase (beta-lactamase class C family)
MFKSSHPLFIALLPLLTLLTIPTSGYTADPTSSLDITSKKSAIAPLDQELSLHTHIQKELSRWKIPGAAVAVLEGGKTLFMETYGVKDTRSKTPINENTRFVLGPCSKLFTHTALLFLADRQMIDLDTPVIEYLPQLRLSDPWVTGNVTTRDILLERIGFDSEQGKLLWKWGYGRTGIIDRLVNLTPTHSFRTYSSNNQINQVIAALLVEATSGLSWEEFTKKHLTMPLSMSSTHIGIGNFQRDSNIALPHQLIKETLTTQEVPEIHAIAPASWISSSVKDLSTFTKMLLLRGSLHQQDLMHKETADMMFQPFIAIDSNDPAHKMLRSQLDLYDLVCAGVQGRVHTYRDLNVIEQSGSIPGYTTLIAIAPEIDTAIVILANRDEPLFPASIKLTILDQLLYKMGKIPKEELTNWGILLQNEAKTQENQSKEAQRLLLAQRQSNTTPRYSPESYAGRYSHTTYGPFIIQIQNQDQEQRLTITAGPAKITGTLFHWHHDVFKIEWSSPYMRQDSFINFQFNTQGLITSAILDEIPNFIRQPSIG